MVGHSRGMTLVETLVSLVVMASVLAIASTAYRFYVERATSEQDRISDSIQQAILAVRIQDSLAALVDYRLASVFGDGGRAQTALVGQGGALVAITDNALSAIGEGALVWLGRTTFEGMTGVWWCERPLTAFLPLTPADLEPAQICDGFRYQLTPWREISFRYLPPDPSQLVDTEFGFATNVTAPAASWQTSFDPSMLAPLPRYVEVTLGTDERESRLMIAVQEADPARTGSFGGFNSD